MLFTIINDVNTFAENIVVEILNSSLHRNLLHFPKNVAYLRNRLNIKIRQRQIIEIYYN